MNENVNERRDGTEGEGEARGGHELFIGHDDPYGARYVHCPCTYV